MKHLVKRNQNGKVTAKCGVITDVQNSTIWWGEADCPVCTPYIWVDDPNGVGKMMVHRDEVRDVPTPPKVRVMRRRSQR